MLPEIPDGGFSVDLAQLGGVAGQIGVAYDELNTAITQYSHEAAAPGDLGTEVANSWSDFDGAWAQELSVFGLAISEAANKVHTAGFSYAAAESVNTSDAERVGGLTHERAV
jgi:hypothetical protein